MKIISGGQTGADRGGLDAAIELGLEHGGWCPFGRQAEDGMIPDKYLLKEMGTGGYRERTRKNVEDSDVTIIFIGDGYNPTGGSRLTAEFCERYRKHHIVLNVKLPPYELINEITEFIKANNPSVINIAGNRESKSPGIQDKVQALLRSAIRDLSRNS